MQTNNLLGITISMDKITLARFLYREISDNLLWHQLSHEEQYPYLSTAELMIKRGWVAKYSLREIQNEL